MSYLRRTKKLGVYCSQMTSLSFFMEFAKRLYELRKRNALTQQGFADLAELHVNQIKRYENGTAQPTLEALTRLAKVLQVSLDDLVFGGTKRELSEQLSYHLELIDNFPDDEKEIIREVLESLIIRYQARRADSGRQSLTESKATKGKKKK